MLLNSWTIDKKIISIMKENYDSWLMDTNYWNKENEWNLNLNNNDKKKLTNYQVFVDMMFNQNICFNNSIKQYSRMLSVFSMLEANSKLIRIMIDNDKFQKCFNEALNDLKVDNKEDIIQLFSDYEYVENESI